MSDNKTTMLDLAGSPSFNYEAAADALNTSNTDPSSKNKNRRNIHLALAAAGMTPGPVGFGADFVDALLYTVEGKFGDAALSSVAMIPFVGQVAAAKRSVDKVIDAGDDYLYLYRGINTKGEDFMTGEMRSLSMDDLVMDIGGIPSHVGGTMKRGSDPYILFKYYGEIPNQKVKSPGFAHIFDIDNNKQFLYASELYTTTSPITAINYAMGQGLRYGHPDVIAKQFEDTLGTVIRYKVPVSHLKKLADTKLPKTGQRALHSNDYFLKKLHNIGTGRNLPRDIEFAQGMDPTGMYTMGFRNTPETGFPGVDFGKSVAKGGNNIVRFDLGIPASYADKIWENKTVTELLSDPELAKTSFQNSSIQRMLRKRNLPQNDANKYISEEYRIDAEGIEQTRRTIEHKKKNNFYFVPRDI